MSDHSETSETPETDDHGAHHGLSHIASVKVLLGTFGALMVLTILTVAATNIDLGTNLNLLLAMVIAFVKASLVVTFFMHLKYDKALHTAALLAAVLFAMLFVCFVVMDSSEYQVNIKLLEADQLLEQQ